MNTAINAGCDLVSISWGGPENEWSSSTITAYNSLFQHASTLPITIAAAAGDNGAGDTESGLNVDFPASSPYVLACGGTHRESNDGENISLEVVWNDNSQSSATGGGISAGFSEPNYQSSVTYNLNHRRGVPAAGDADPNTGDVLYSQSAGGQFIVGGTKCSGSVMVWSFSSY